MRRFIGSMILLGSGILNADPAQAGYVLTANAVGSQSSTVSGVTTETFDSFGSGKYTSLTTAVGTLSSPGLAIVSHDQYGGAGGTGKYFSIGAQSGQVSATLTLNGPQAYFGFWWSAADPLNQIKFLSGGQEVASFDPTSALGSLDSSYKGNPNGGDASEKFAYLNFIGTSGSTFDQISFSNLNASTGFESDNWSVLSTQLAPPYPGTPISGFGSVPEPSSIALTVIGLLAVIGLGKRSRSNRAPFE